MKFQVGDWIIDHPRMSKPVQITDIIDVCGIGKGAHLVTELGHHHEFEVELADAFKAWVDEVRAEAKA